MTDPNGGIAALSTEPPASRYGIPVLEIDGCDVSGADGDANLIGDPDRPESLISAAAVAAAWARKPERTSDELDAALGRYQTDEKVALAEWRIERQSGRRGEEWHVVWFGSDEGRARKAYQKRYEALRQGGLKLVRSDGRIEEAASAPRVRTRW